MLRQRASVALFALKATLIALIALAALIPSCSYNPYHFEEYQISRIDLDEKNVPVGSKQRSVDVSDVSVGISVYTSEWETWDKKKLGGPYRIGFRFEQGCQDPEEWHSDVLVTKLSLSQQGKTTIIEGFPERLMFKETPTVPGTPRQNGAGRMLEEM